MTAVATAPQSLCKLQTGVRCGSPARVRVPLEVDRRLGKNRPAADADRCLCLASQSNRADWDHQRAREPQRAHDFGSAAAMIVAHDARMAGSQRAIGRAVSSPSPASASRARLKFAFDLFERDWPLTFGASPCLSLKCGLSPVSVLGILPCLRGQPIEFVLGDQHKLALANLQRLRGHDCMILSCVSCDCRADAYLW